MNTKKTSRVMQWKEEFTMISLMIPISMKKSKNLKCTYICTKHPRSFNFKFIEESILLSTNIKIHE